jgi:predicted NAD/FAD-dependent oxidoreductase
MSEVIRWIARNNTKPGRSARGESILIHASPSWSRESEDAEPEMIAEELFGEVSHVLGLPPVRPVHMTAHLWHHGLVDQSLGETFIYSREHKVGVAGDWCLGRLAEHVAIGDLREARQGAKNRDPRETRIATWPMRTLAGERREHGRSRPICKFIHR